MKFRKIEIITMALVLMAVLISVIGCSDDSSGGRLLSRNLSASVSAQPIPEKDVLTETEQTAMADFAVRLFQNSLAEEGNTLISPFSVLSALSMTANGAENDTLSQMETVLGLKAGELNAMMAAYRAQLADTDKSRLHLANSIWMKDDPDFAVNQEFLQMNADYYGAEIYQSAFDSATVRVINDWVNENTYGMIPEILNEIPDEALMYLVNALAFDAEWDIIYKESQIQPDPFTTEAGEKQEVDFMYSEEYEYLEDENTTGFIKYYNGMNYAFAALLPEEGMTIADYVQSLSGAKLQNLFENTQFVPVSAALPKFRNDYDVEMSEILAGLGMVDAFDSKKADFTALGTYPDANIYISRVLHKTFIAVDEKGTKAGAATVVEMAKETAMVPVEKKEVWLDRPFVYMILDCENQIPLFIGTVEHFNA